MKIVQFISTLGSGGAESVVRDYAVELKRRGHSVEVIVLLPRLHNYNEQILIDNGIIVRSIYEEIFWINSTSLLFRVLRKPFRDTKVRRWIDSYVSSNKPDVFHVHLSLLHFLTSETFCANSVRLFFTCHSEAAYYFGNKSDAEYVSACELLNKNNLNMIALNRKMADDLNRIFNINNTIVLNNPINLNRLIHPQKNRNEIRLELHFTDKDFVIGHVGRFIELKNHRFLIEVFEKVVEHKPNAKLLLVGDGPLRKEIEMLCDSFGIREKVVFTGIRSDVPELLAAMDAFVFPSQFEGLGISFVEAQAVIPLCIASSTVPSDTAVSATVCFVSLEKDAEYWADVLMNPEPHFYPKQNDIASFDIACVVDALEVVYGK